MSLAPSSRITASAPSPSVQSSRARPSALVSPETPALTTSTSRPCALEGGLELGRETRRPRRGPRPSHEAVAVGERAGSTSPPQGRRGMRPPGPRLSGCGQRPHMRAATGGRRRAYDLSDRDGGHRPQSRAGGRAGPHPEKHKPRHRPAARRSGSPGRPAPENPPCLMAMAGLERADSGRIMIEGTDIGRLGEDKLARFRGQRIGIVFQSFHLIPTMNASGKRRRAAGTRRPPRRLRQGARRAGGGGARRTHHALPRPAVGRRAAARGFGPGDRAAPRRSSSPTSRPATSMRRRGRRSST